MKQIARIVVLAAMLTPAAAMAQLQTYYHAGAWDAFSGRSDASGGVCGVGTTIPVDNRRLSIRFDIGGASTVFSADKPDWSVPANTPVTVVMQVGLSTPWTERATGHDHRIDWTVGPDDMVTFDRQFRGAASMTLTFPDGNEPPWALSLAGSTAISDTFGRCVRDLTRQVQETKSRNDGSSNTSTPPAPAPTQPFTAPASPGTVAPPR